MKRTWKAWTICLTVGAILLGGCASQPKPVQEPANASVQKMTPIERWKTENQPYMDYLKKNKAPLSLQDGTLESGFDLLEDDLVNHDFFFTGETHEVARNYDIQWHLLQYLNQKAGVNYCLGEMSFSWSQFINAYLETGDEKYMPKLTKQSVELYRKIYEYNQSIPKEKQIRFLGIDVDHDSISGFAYIAYLLERRTDLPSELEPLAKEMEAYRLPISAEKVETLRKRIPETVALLKKTALPATLDADTRFRLELTVRNIVDGIALHEYFESNHPKFDSDRELIMWENFKTVYNHFPTGKYYGEWGMAHVYLKEYASPSFVDKAPKIVQYINEMEQTKGKVLAIAMTYAASQNHIWGQDEPGWAGGTLDDMALIGPLAETDTTLYKLNGEGSPFKEHVKFVRGALCSRQETR